MTYSRTCGIDQADCTMLACSCANEPHTPTQAEREAFWADEPVRTTPERPQAGREPHSKPRVVPIIPGFGNHVEWFVVTDCCSIEPGDEPPDDYCVWDWHFYELGEAMDAAHAHVREHHALTSANHTPTWEPCGRGICAANAGHEGTCEEASGFYDWTPEFYDDGLDAHDDPDPSTEAWRELLATSREDT